MGPEYSALSLLERIRNYWEHKPRSIREWKYISDQVPKFEPMCTTGVRLRSNRMFNKALFYYWQWWTLYAHPSVVYKFSEIPLKRYRKMVNTTSIQWYIVTFFFEQMRGRQIVIGATAMRFLSVSFSTDFEQNETLTSMPKCRRRTAHYKNCMNVMISATYHFWNLQINTFSARQWSALMFTFSHKYVLIMRTFQKLMIELEYIER